MSPIAVYVGAGVQCAIYLNIGEHRIYFGIDLRTWTAGGNRTRLNPIHPAGMVESTTKSRSAARSRRFSSGINVLELSHSQRIFFLAIQGGTALAEQRTGFPEAPLRQSPRGEPATCRSPRWH